MKEVKAKLSNLQIAPRKVRLLADLIRGASVEEAKKQLSVSSKQAALPMLKLVNSAVANAEHNFQLDASTLRIKSIMVGEGRKLKRFKPRAFGRASLILKRASHVFMVLEGEKSKAPTKKKSSPKKKTKKKEDQPKPEKDEKNTGSKGVQRDKIDPRRLGHERPTQHQKDKSGIVKV